MATSPQPHSSSPKPTKLRFKKTRRPRPTAERPRSRSRSPSPAESTPHRRRTRHQTQHQTQHQSSSPSPPQTRSPHSPNDSPLTSETAFRESLFDALADPDGAAYWANVYGQPIHIYSRFKPRIGTDNSVLRDDTGNPIYERMDDDEYTAYVRAKLWEKSHEHIAEERQRRLQERRKVREAEKRAAHRQRQTERQRREEEAEKARLRRAHEERFVFDRGWAPPSFPTPEEALSGARVDFEAEERLEEERRQVKAKKRKERLARLWEGYIGAWEGIVAAAKGEDDSQSREERRETLQIPWPTKSGRAEDITAEEVENFFKMGATVMARSDAAPGDGLVGLLKTERVRWHPDKVAHRVGKRRLSDEERKTVTATFQVIDRLYTQLAKRGNE